MFLQVLKNYVSMIRSGPEYFALAFEPGLARAREVLQNLGFALLPKRCNYLHATKVESYRLLSTCLENLSGGRTGSFFPSYTKLEKTRK